MIGIKEIRLDSISIEKDKGGRKISDEVDLVMGLAVMIIVVGMMFVISMITRSF